MGMRELHLETQVKRALNLNHIGKIEFSELMEKVKWINGARREADKEERAVWKAIARKD